MCSLFYTDIIWNFVEYYGKTRHKNTDARNIIVISLMYIRTNYSKRNGRNIYNICIYIIEQVNDK